MSKFSTSWNLLKDSWQVLMRDKEIMLFPIASGIACFLVLLTFILPWIAASALNWRGMLRDQSDSVMLVLLFFYYLCNFFVMVFFNAALVDFVVTRLRGGEPTVGGSLRAAVACLPQIAVWSLISATVGVILDWLSERAGFIARIAISLVGVAWTLLTYFVVPFMVIDRRGALDAIGDSKELLRRTWGQQIISGVGFGLVGFLLLLPGIALLIAAILGVSMSRGSGWEFWVMLGVAAVLYLVALGVVLSTLKAIFGAALYLFATSGKTPDGFFEDDLRGAIKPA